MPNIVDDAPAIRAAMDALGMRPWVPRSDAPPLSAKMPAPIARGTIRAGTELRLACGQVWTVTADGFERQELAEASLAAKKEPAPQPAGLTPPQCLAILNERAANVNGVATVTLPTEWLWELLGYINATLEPVENPLRSDPEPE